MRKASGAPTPEVSEVLSRFEIIGDCHVYTGAKDWDGYGLCKRFQKSIRVHRLSFEFHNGERIPSGMHVMHSCDNPPCINPWHLSIGSPQENVIDCHKKGRAQKHGKGAPGVRNGSARLTENEVREIRYLGSRGFSQTEIGRMYGITQPAARYIIIGKTWKHVK